jgi:hypothetical protein
MPVAPRFKSGRKLAFLPLCPRKPLCPLYRELALRRLCRVNPFGAAKAAQRKRKLTYQSTPDASLGQMTKHIYEVRQRKDHRGVDLISDALAFGRLWYAEPDAVANAIGYAEHRSRSHDAVISL